MTSSAKESPAPVPDARGLNLLDADPRFADLLRLYLPPAVDRLLQPHLHRLGALAGGALDELAWLADRHPPQLHHRDRQGFDRQWIERHPAYREMERVAFADYGLAAMSHRGGVLGADDPLPPAAKYALTYLFVQAEFGLCCPLSMTDALTRTLRRFGDPALVARYLPALTATDLDHLAQGAMFITERQAGSDVGRVETVARRDGEAWRLTGEKWFCSNADADLALVLARPEGAPAGTRGLALFLLPRLLPDGQPNRYRIVRLKEKLGSRSMPSGEILLDGALAHAVGDPAKGFVQMADMINMSRLSNGVRAAGMMRRALTEALFVARHRTAFGSRLIDLPLMRRQLLKLMLPTEAARSFFLVAAGALDAADAGDATAGRLIRILTPLIKFRACRDARRVAGDAMEVRGGAGYIEEWADPRLVRDTHLGSIWEGTSNVVALDVMRAIRREDAGRALGDDLTRRIDGLADLPPAFRARLAGAVRRAVDLASRVAGDGDERAARQAASALYWTAAACFMADEAQRLATTAGDMRRALLADLALTERIEPRDPLAPPDAAREAALAGLLLDETPVPPARALPLLAG